MVNFLPGITEARRWTTNSKTTIFRITHNMHLLKRIIHTLLYCSSIGGSEHIAVDRASLFIALYRRNLRLHVLYYITRHVLSNLRRGVRLISSRGRRRERDRARSFQSRGPICRHTHIYVRGWWLGGGRVCAGWSRFCLSCRITVHTVHIRGLGWCRWHRGMLMIKWRLIRKGFCVFLLSGRPGILFFPLCFKVYNVLCCDLSGIL